MHVFYRRKNNKENPTLILKLYYMYLKIQLIYLSSLGNRKWQKALKGTDVLLKTFFSQSAMQSRVRVGAVLAPCDLAVVCHQR